MPQHREIAEARMREQKRLVQPVRADPGADAGICIVEWSQYIPEAALPKEFLDIRLESCEKGRFLTVMAHGQASQALAQELHTAWTTSGRHGSRTDLPLFS